MNLMKLSIIIIIFFSSFHFMVCMKQVNILLRELCRLHTVPLPSELDTLLLPPNAEFYKLVSNAQQQNEQHAAVDDSDAEEIEDATLESEPESEVDEDLSLEMDDGRNANKVCAFNAKPVFQISGKHL